MGMNPFVTLPHRLSALAALLLCLVSGWRSCAAGTDWPQYETNPFVIPLDIPAPQDSAGGIVTADLTGDGRMDYLVTVPGHVAAYGNDGAKLWVLQADVVVGSSSENEGLPGHHGAGVQAADIDGDGKTEALFLTKDRRLHVVNGADGAALWQAEPPHPDGAVRWEHLVVANFRGKGDRDLLLQATNKDGYRMGRYLAAFTLDRLKGGDYTPLWAMDDFLACAHNGARIADLNGDGRHEVYAVDIISHDGQRLFRPPLRGHMDAVIALPVLPGEKGLQVVGLEEGGPQRVFLFNHEKLFWETDYNHWEPQNTAVGEFDPALPGLEIWCRSRFNEHQKPFVFNANGELIAEYALTERAPEDWTVSGVEVIAPIHWTGGETQLAAAKERHTEGDAGIFEPLTGRFVARFPAEAARIYVADVSGDWREEVIVLHKNELRIHHNPEPNPRPGEKRLWDKDYYKRAKMTWNYYSP
ncbi:MAG: VCBS repeat-containing protein [Candidatus Hydrogenedentes bacterium]|nr:VCBS repeat-containing protein [Candidatus Hydrogenedentota bacterium]